MLSYYIDNTNIFTFRTEDTASNQFELRLQDMLTQANTTASISGVTFTAYENILAFTASISGAYVGQEFRARVWNSGSSNDLWHGSMQVYGSQSVEKSAYKTQNNQYVSNITTNDFIIL